MTDLPLTQDAAAARQGRHKITFDRTLPSRFGVIPRRGQADEIRWFDAEPCYIYHVVNAWEQGRTIILDVYRATRPEPVATRPGALAKLLAYLRLDDRLHRYVFDLGTEPPPRPSSTTPTEFPSIDIRRCGRPSRYADNVHIAHTETVLFDGLLRYDRETGARQDYRFGPSRFGSEAPFAPRDGGVAADDGYLVSFVTDERDGHSEVQILDAADLAAGPVGRVLLPQRVPVGFHATWVWADQLRS